MNKIKAILKKIINRREMFAVTEMKKEGELLKNKNALIVGGTSGIGYAIAELFKDNGAEVIVIGSNPQKCQVAMEQLGLHGFYVLDLEAMKEAEIHISKISSMFENGNIDILINSAGITDNNNFLNSTPDKYDKVMKINVRGVYFISQAVSKLMISKGIKGYIINISSSSSAKPATSPYKVSKWAIRGLTLGMAESLLSYGIKVSAIAPGKTATSMMGINSSGNVTCDGQPSGRYVMPKEVANMALFLASGLGDSIIGDTIFVSGGNGTISI